MHKLMDFICSEMEELERKADKDGKLSMAEVQYLDTLAHTKKNLLKADEMWEDSEYSGASGSYARGRGGRYSRNSSYDGYMEQGGSYARGRGRNANRDSMGRYSRGGDTEMMVEELRELMQDVPDNQTKMEFQKFIQKIESM